MTDSASGRDIVLFLGTVFSCAAGLGTMAKFGCDSKKELETIRRERLKDRIGASLLEKAGSCYERFSRHCATAKEFVECDPCNMEEVYSIAESLRQSGRDLPRDIAADFAELDQNIRLWLWKIFQRCPPVDDYTRDRRRDELKHLPPYRSFFKCLKDARLRDRIGVITTNYDLVFEYMLWKEWEEAEYKCTYDLSSDAQPLRLAPEKTPPLPDFVSILDPDSRTVPVYKIHGSVDFFSKANNRENCETESGLLVVTDTAGPPTRTLDASGNPCPIIDGRPWDLENAFITKDDGKSHHFRPTVFAFDAGYHLLVNEGLNPEIIPPTYAKIEDTPWLKRTWGNALRLVRSAKHIVFIGYSMPTTDGFIRSFFQAAFAGRPAGEGLKVTVFDPDDKVEKRYKDLFLPLGQNLTFHSQTLVDAIRTGALEKALTPTD